MLALHRTSASFALEPGHVEGSRGMSPNAVAAELPRGGSVGEPPHFVGCRHGNAQNSLPHLQTSGLPSIAWQGKLQALLSPIMMMRLRVSWQVPDRRACFGRTSGGPWCCPHEHDLARMKSMSAHAHAHDWLPDTRTCIRSG